MRKHALAAVFTVVALFSTSSLANAAFELRYSLDGGATFSAPVIGSVGTPLSVTVDGLNVNASSTSFIGSAMSGVDLQVTGVLSGVANILVQVTLSDISTGPPPQTLTTIYTGSSLPAGVTLIADTWVDTANGLFTTGTATHNGPLSPGGTSSVQYSAAGLHSVTAQISLTSSSGTHLISTDNNNLITNAPAPAGLVLALAGAPFLGFGAWLRRRKAALLA